MRIQYKGGVWKNSEDEILKAAIMKYGMNQWARIASLLVRKSAKQCKARWYEWLDPSIKKTPWSKGEEEKLLHLAKVMPTQWRSIAPMIGRTAAQCLEHYEKLLDQAQQTGEGEHGAATSQGAGPSSDPQRGAREGEFAPEGKPARPDAVDMDEDELEMLGEARARLANTKGKKAKRKAREKELDVAKRIANLQKRRELKAAGIAMKPRRRDRREPDLAVEIPFQRAPVPGFYDTREEDEQAARLRTDVGNVGKLLENYEGKRHDEIERVRRKQDEQRRKEYEERDLPGALGLNGNPAAAAFEPPPLQGLTLSLPKPQVSDAELEAIAKAGTMFAAKAKSGPQNGVTDRLIPERNPVLATPTTVHGGATSVASTPRTTPAETWADARQRHVQTILNLQNADTPLVGGENTPLPGRIADDPAATPVMHTPNPLATPSEMSFASGLSGRGAKKAQKAKMAALKKKVQERLDALATPDNEYQFDVAAMEAQMEDEGEETGNTGPEAMDLVEDAEEKEKRLEKEGNAKLVRAKRRSLSQAARRSLPRPEEAWASTPEFPADLRPLVQRDIAVGKLLASGEKGARAGQVAADVEKILSEDPNSRFLAEARALVKAEAESNSGGLTVKDFAVALESVDDARKEWVLRDNGKIAVASTDEDMTRVLAAREVHAAECQKAENKLLKKLGTVTAGFERRLAATEEAVGEEWDKLAELEQQIECVEALEEAEKEAVVDRVQGWEKCVREMKERHAELQQAYADLD